MNTLTHPTALGGANFGADAFLERHERFRDHLPGDAAVRDQAAEHFRRLGLPGVKVEAWRYTSLRPLAEVGFQEPLTAVSTAPGPDPAPVGLDAPRLVFLDGRYQPGLSTPPEGVEVQSFADAPDFGRLPRPDREAMVALNTMLAEDGAILRVADASGAARR